MQSRQQRSGWNVAPIRLGLWLAAAMAAIGALLPTPAEARLGDGLKVGPGRLHLGVEAEARYDSLVGAGAFGVDNGANELNPGDGIGRLRGTFLLDVPGQNVKINFNGVLDWNQYLGLFVNTSALSYIGASVTGGVSFNPSGALGLDLTETFSRSDRSSNPVFGVGVIGLNNGTRARVRWRPGGGAIETGLAYDFGADIFSPQVTPAGGATGICAQDPSCNPDQAAAFNALSHRFTLDGKWRVLPKTGFSLETSYGFRSYLFGTEYIANVGVSPLRAMLGFGTLVSTRFSFSVKGGYQGMFFDNVAVTPVHSWIGQAELGFRLTETFQLRGGFIRSFEPVGGVSHYFNDNRFYVDFRAQFSRLLLSALGSVDVIGFGDGRADFVASVGTRAEYNVSDWFRITGGLAYMNRVSNESESGESKYTFDRFEISAGLATLF